MIQPGFNTDHCFMIFFRGVNQEEVEDILETWLKVRSWVIFQWGVSEERGGGTDLLHCLSDFGIFTKGSSQKP